MRILVSILFCFVVGCASLTEVPSPSTNPLPPLTEAQPYFIDMEQFEIQTPEPIFLNKQFQLSPKEKAFHIAFDPDQFKKIVELKTIYLSQLDIIEKQSLLINSHVNQINGLNRLVELKNRQIEEYYNLYSETEYSLKKEKRDHRLDNIINRVTIYVVGVLNAVLIITMW